jgi:hypothetical protein
MLSDGLVKTAELPATLGGFADVWNGVYRDKTVAIKAFRIYNPNDLLAIKKVNIPVLFFVLRLKPTKRHVL